MTPIDIISNFRQSEDSDPNPVWVEAFAFHPTQIDWSFYDFNMEYRTEVVNQLLKDFSIQDINLIRLLIQEELECSRSIREHGNIYQLCYYLFELGDLSDTFLIYQIKYMEGNMDAGAMVDREMLTVGHPIEKVIHYVNDRFQADSTLKEKYSGILDQLEGLKNFPDYESLEDYRVYINGYFKRS